MPDHYDEEGNIPGPGEPQYDEIYRKENWAGRPLKNLSALGLAALSKKPIESVVITATSSILEHFFPDDDNTVIPPYSSGAVVQTKDGPLYRPEQGTMTSTFMSTRPDYSSFEWVKGIDQLDPKGPRPIFASSDMKRKLSAEQVTGDVVTKEVDELFKESGRRTLGAWEDKLNINFEKAGVDVDIHHIGLLRQIAEATNGLNPEWRLKSGDYMERRLRRKIGYSEENAVPLPKIFHRRLHNLINARIGKGTFSLRGIEEKFNLPKDWKSTYTYKQRERIYNELIDSIADSTKAIDTFWNYLHTRSGTTTLSRKEFMKATFDIMDLDKRLSKISSGGQAYTATEIINNILKAAERGYTSPIFKPLDASMTREALRVTKEENGWKALYEAVVMNQSYDTIKKVYGFNIPPKLVNIIKKDKNAYQHMLRSRGKSIPPVDSIWNLGQDN